MFGWPLPLLAAALLVSLGAGVVRGFSGFGYSALTVAGLAVFAAPSTIVPAVLLLEVLASLGLWRAATAAADGAWLRWLLPTNLLLVPAGVAMLAILPELRLRLLVSLTLLSSAVLLWRLSERTLAPSARLRFAAGVTSGLLNGLAASGGVAAAMLMATTRPAATAMRATMISFVFFSCAYTLLCAALVPLGTARATPLLGADTLRWALLLAPSMFVGIWIGHRAFANADPRRYRRFVLLLLVSISALGALRSGFEMLRG